MKTKTYIALIVLLALSFNLSAVEAYTVKGVDVPPSGINIMAPVTPNEATFEEDFMISLPLNLAPVTPDFADFNEALPDPAANELLNASPVVPEEATFDEEVTPDGYSTEYLNSLKPSVPSQADFEDLN
ncbi:MAG: hypothetical protein ACM3N9_08655 [Syntrophothermus sp.]